MHGSRTGFELIVVTTAAMLLLLGLVLFNIDGTLARLENSVLADAVGLSFAAELGRVVSGPTAGDADHVRSEAGPSPDTDDLAWYSAQLHIHGWSNHNGLSQPASLQAHSVWADASGLDAIWWSEHNPTYYQVADTTIDLSSATISTTLNIAIPPPAAISSEVYELRAAVTGNGQATANLAGGLLRMQMASGNDLDFDTFSYRAMGYNGLRPQGLFFTRPIASDVRLGFDASLCGDHGSDAYAEVRVGLSWHNYGVAAPQELVYRLVPSGDPSSIVNSSTRVTVTVPLSTTHVELPLLAHASRLPDGDDNSVQELYLKVGGRNGATSCLQIGNFSLHSVQPLPQQIFQEHRQVTQRHQATYGVTEVTSWEQFAGIHHMNPYLPSNAALLPGRNDIYVSTFVPLIHSQNGLVALNHPFGASYGPFLPPEQQEAMVQSLLDAMIPARGWQLDMIEIYKSRARVDQAHHLRLWDLLAVNNVPLCAVSASDAHGMPFYESHYMVSWIEATAPTQDAILDGMRRCRVFFGDLSRFDGVLDLRLDGIPMGGSYPVHPGVTPLQIILDPVPAGARVELVQFRWIPGRELSHIVNHQVVDPTLPVMIDTSEPSFVRVELYAANGQPMAFSNRIAIEPLQCDVNTNGQIDIADVQSVASAFGQQVPPARAGYDLWPDQIIDVRDVMRAADCWISKATSTGRDPRPML